MSSGAFLQFVSVMIGWAQMTKLLAGFGLIILLTTLSFAGKSVGESEGPGFQEPEVVKAGELKYPVNSVAYELSS